MATVIIESVSQFFDKNCVLQDISFKINKGEFLVIVGPSGCGKSTLLRLIAGLDVVQSGSILINDQCVNTTKASSRDIAMVFQNYALYPHMTVYDNMAYGLKMRKINKNEIKRRVDAVSRQLHLSDCLNRKPSALSGGQRQRVAMGRAIVRSPAVFLFDEPLSNLDFKLRTEMRHEIKKLHQELNATCIYVTHDQTEAMTMADRLVVLHQGKVQQIGTPREVYDRPDSLFVAGFLGHFPMNFIHATLNTVNSTLNLSVGLELPIPNLNREQDAENEALVVGIRPEHCRLTSTPGPDAFEAQVDLVDDMGSDKLIRVVSTHGAVAVCVRVPGDTPIIDDPCFIQVDRTHAMVFNEQNGQRLGGWNAI